MSAGRIAAIHDYVEALGTAPAQWDGLRTRPPPGGPRVHSQIRRDLPGLSCQPLQALTCQDVAQQCAPVGGVWRYHKSKIRPAPRPRCTASDPACQRWDLGRTVASRRFSHPTRRRTLAPAFRSIQYNNIASATAPDPTNVLATQAPNTSLGAVLSQLFHGDNKPAASTHYLMNYTPSMNSVNVTGSGDTWNAGDTYTQAG
jgi:hypothetical protein